MFDEKARETVRDILATAADDRPLGVPLINLSGISGNGHTFHIHINAGSVPPGTRVAPDRRRHLAEIAARLKRVRAGDRRLATHLRHTYGVERLDELEDVELADLDRWVDSLPTRR